MSRKSKGINAERNLVHQLWALGWAAIRIAGSGSMKYPAADVLATNKLRRLAIECKTCGNLNKYLKKAEIEQLREFSELFNAEPWIAVKFDRHEWLFVDLEDLTNTGNNYLISYNNAINKGLSLNEVIK